MNIPQYLVLSLRYTEICWLVTYEYSTTPCFSLKIYRDLLICNLWIFHKTTHLLGYSFLHAKPWKRIHSWQIYCSQIGIGHFVFCEASLKWTRAILKVISCLWLFTMRSFKYHIGLLFFLAWLPLFMNCWENWVPVVSYNWCRNFLVGKYLFKAKKIFWFEC